MCCLRSFSLLHLEAKTQVIRKPVHETQGGIADAPARDKGKLTQYTRVIREEETNGNTAGTN